MRFDGLLIAVCATVMLSAAARADAPDLPERPLSGRTGVVNIGTPPAEPGEALQVLSEPNKIGVTNLTFVNYDQITHRVRVFAGSHSAIAGRSSGPGCVVGSGPVHPDLEFIVAANSTLVVPYPTPLVFSPSGGATCIFAQLLTKTQIGNVSVMATGFAAPPAN